MNAVLKLGAIFCLRLFMHILTVFPIKKNRIILNAYKGSQYSCNPKYISEYLFENYPQKFEIIWAFNEPQKFSFLKKDGIKVVKYCSIKRFFYEATCKISINNIGSYSWFPVRKGQEHVNTWHGGYNIKKVGLMESANSFLMKRTIQMSSDYTTELLSTSEKYDNDIAVEDLGYRKRTFQCGYPRNDILFKQKNGEVNLKNKVAGILGFNENSYVVLYVPTYRYDVHKVWEHPDYAGIKEELLKQGKLQPVIITRMHHFMTANMGDGDSTIDATGYPDMQELLASADCIITDYSSCIWDYAIMRRPIYLYVPDYEQYEKERGYHVNIHELGFPVAQSNIELLSAFRNMTEKNAQINAEQFVNSCHSYESGTASAQVGAWIYEKCFGGGEN